MHENRDDWVVQDGSMEVPIKDHQPADEPEMPFDGFEEPADKAGTDATERCAPDGIDPGDPRYIGEAVEVDFETGAVTVVHEEPAAHERSE